METPAPFSDANNATNLWDLPGGKPGRLHGDGNGEVLDVVNIFRDIGIVSCVVGVGALKYYGAHRVLHNWELCVPDEDFSKALKILKSPLKILKSPPYDNFYMVCKSPEVYHHSMLHAYPLFQPKGVAIRFQIVPSCDYHIECTSSNIEYSQNGLPYPKLPVFAQALLDSNDIMSLTDLIDGMDLDDAWAHMNLDLSGTNDVVWAEKKNERIQASLPDPEVCGFLLPTASFHCAETWSEIVNTKQRRIGAELPEGYYSTRFHPKGGKDPRTRDRPFV